jgi:hypothetical protein
MSDQDLLRESKARKFETAADIIENDPEGSFFVDDDVLIEALKLAAKAVRARIE